MNEDDKQKTTFHCRHCQWTGPGNETKVGDFFDAGYEIHCPKCGERLPGLIEFKLIDKTGPDKKIK